MAFVAKNMAFALNMCLCLNKMKSVEDEKPSVLKLFQQHMTEFDTRIQWYQYRIELLRQSEEDYELSKIHSFEEQCKELEENKQFFLLNLLEPIEEYKQCISQKISITLDEFIKKTDFIPTQTTQLESRIHDLFYMYAPRKEIQPVGETCVSCSYNKLIHVDSISNVCAKCGTEQPILHNQFSYSDSSRVNMSNKYMYVRQVHFRDCMNQFQGKQNCQISEELLDKLRSMIDKFQLPYQTLTRQDIVQMLKELKCQKQFKNVRLIHHRLTGEPLPDISNLEQKLLQDFNILSELFNQLFIETKKTDRSSFINTNYILYQLLKKHKYPCEEHDFQLLKTFERKKFCDETCRELFKHLNWNFTPLF